MMFSLDIFYFNAKQLFLVFKCISCYPAAFNLLFSLAFQLIAADHRNAGNRRGRDAAGRQLMSTQTPAGCVQGP